MMGYGYGWNGWMIVAMFAWPLAVGAAIWAVAVLTRGSGTVSPSARPDTPLEILDRRLADGEITVAEYDEIRAALTHRSPGRVAGPH